MLEGASIICFAHDWEGDPTSKTHIMRILSKKNRILWVNSIAMRRPSATRRDIRRILFKVRRAFAGAREVEPNIFVTNPLVLPLPGVALAEKLNAELLTASLRRLSRRLGLDRPILWTFLPNVNRVIGRLRERMVIYHCVDEYSAFSGVPREALMRMEQDLVRRADLVLTSGERLGDERRALNEHTHFVSHGVDVDHFARTLDPRTEIPADIRGIPRPIVGFFGLLADWVDIDTFRAIATARPQWSVVLIGKAATDIESLRGIPNLHILGQKPYGALPGYCRAFDVGIIPFRVNELTVRANPLKLREYLAAGLPVVSTPLPEVARYDGLVRLASSPEAFIHAVEAALADRSEIAKARRVDAMRTEGWIARVEEISALIAARLGRVGTGVK
jgi:glycosyltransferase involved in cell wall biosynthesis